MARPILVYGHPAAGKSYAFKTLNPDTTIILDVDNKGALPWKGFKKSYNRERKNFFPADTLDRIFSGYKKSIPMILSSTLLLSASTGLTTLSLTNNAFMTNSITPKILTKNFPSLLKRLSASSSLLKTCAMI